MLYKGHRQNEILRPRRAPCIDTLLLSQRHYRFVQRVPATAVTPMLTMTQQIQSSGSKTRHVPRSRGKLSHPADKQYPGQPCPLQARAIEKKEAYCAPYMLIYQLRSLKPRLENSGAILPFPQKKYSNSQHNTRGKVGINYQNINFNNVYYPYPHW